jgi:LacI family transcriptional regulator
LKNILFFISLDRNCFSSQLEGIYRYSRNRSWHVQVVEESLSPKELRKTLDFWNPEGVFFEYGDRANIDFSVFGNIPVVCIDIGRRRPSPGSNVVGLDSEAVGRMGAQYLQGLGLGNFAYIGYREKILWDGERLQGFSRQLEKGGNRCHVFAENEKSSVSQRHSKLRSFLKGLPLPCGVMACNDRVGEEVLNACAFAGIRVPEEVAVIGVDNDVTLCENTSPTLTTINPDVSRSGYLAAQMLDGMMSHDGGGGKFENKCFYPPLKVVARQSTRRLAVDHSAVASALEMIRRRSCEGIGVEDVVKMMGVSRRSAENHFRMATGRTILDEINEVRFAKVLELLRSSRQSISSISGLCGFSTEVALRKAFKLRMGVSMREWRKCCAHDWDAKQGRGQSVADMSRRPV